MITEIIDDILKAEEQASQMIAQASEDAKAMVANADEECEKIRNIAKNEVKEDRKKAVESANKEGDTKYRKILDLGKKETDKLKESTDITKAVEFIKQKVLKSYGDC